MPLFNKVDHSVLFTVFSLIHHYRSSLDHCMLLVHYHSLNLTLTLLFRVSIKCTKDRINIYKNNPVSIL